MHAQRTTPFRYDERMQWRAFAILGAWACSDVTQSLPDGDSSDDATATTDAPTTSDASATFTPAALPASSAELANPLRGQYLWLGVPANPTSWPDVDAYVRWNWAQLEPSHGNYQWKLIDDQIAAATARHGRFGMRIMALCQGCGDHMYKNAHTSIPDDFADVVNPLIGSAPGDTDKYLIPDWNQCGLLHALG